ncbi:MAG: tetratricopeptide repeat protein [Candidatus Hydrogenedentes bacterium]|nr:tetratricopeptide repeat protein [Candidatus Hydrogenedentota bacterium]
MHRNIAWSALLAVTLFSGCVTTGSKNMETVVTDMHQRVNLLDTSMADSLARLNETTATLMARVSENEQQIRLLASLMEENQRKVDNLIKMLEDLKKTLYRHWGLSYSPTPIPKSRPSQEPAPVESPEAATSSASTVPAEIAQPAGAEAAPPLISEDKANADDGNAFAAAKAMYESEDYAGAIAAFTAFLDTYAKSPNRDKAQFWIAKSLLNQSEYSRAIEAFEAVRSNYPDSSYMAYALHNQAVAHYKLGDRETAVALMEEVVANYPTSTAAEHASRDLESLRKGNP